MRSWLGRRIRPSGRSRSWLAEVAPKPYVPTTIRKLPARREPSKPAPIVELCPDVVEAPTSPAPRPAPVKPVVVEPLAPARYRIQFTASAALHEKLERLVALMPGTDLASIVEVAVTEKLERVEAKRFGKTKKPRKKPSPGGHVSRLTLHLRASQALRVRARSGTMHRFESKRTNAAPLEKDSSTITTIHTVSAVTGPLTISIITAHGGYIEIESEEGEGTMARVSLPVVAPEAT